MSVLKSKRRISKIAYEASYTDYLRYIKIKLQKLPKRYSHFLIEPFFKVNNKVYKEILEMSNEYILTKKNGVDRYRRCASILNDIEDIICMSYTYWNLSGADNEIKYLLKKKREHWADLINKEIKLF